VRDADGYMIAGAFERGGGGWCWALPHIPEHPELWLAAALENWHKITPDRIPALPGWRSRPTWATREEVTVRANLALLREEQARVSAELAQREAELIAAETVATAAADAGPRRLLTAQGDELVGAVIDALTALGFEVQNVDDDTDASGTPKVEDLRLTDPDDPAWTNITEVRGYKGGAQLGDFQRLARFANLYQVRTGKLPTSRWYIVNQFFHHDPDTRRPPLAGSDDDVVVFAEDGGLVVDTRDLFQLVRRIERGTTAPAAALALLRGSGGVLHLPAVVEDQPD